MKKIVLPASVLFSGLMLAACGGGGGKSDNGDTSVPPEKTGSIKVTLSGLPEGQSYPVTVTGPNNFSKTVTHSSTLTDLTAGTYSLSAVAVAVNQVTFIPDLLQTNIKIDVNSQGEAQFSYAAPTFQRGKITGFGSVFVNGIKFDTENTQFKVDNDSNKSENDLKLGMIVKVKGTRSANGEVAQASNIEFDNEAQGYVDKVDLAKRQVTLLNQVFQINDLTQIESEKNHSDPEIQLSEIKVGEFIEISAFEAIDGIREASRIEVQSQPEAIQLTGFVEGLDTHNQSFKIGQLTIDFSQLNDLKEFHDGNWVEITALDKPENNILTITDLEVVELLTDENQYLVLEGEISDLTAKSFKLSGLSINFNTETDFNNGARPDLQNGQFISVEAISADKQVIAKEINFIDSADIEIEGSITHIDLEQNLLTVLGAEFAINSHTLLEDDSNEPIKDFSITHLSVGDWVEISAFENEEKLVARKLEREDLNNKLSSELDIEGRVTKIDQSAFTLTLNGVKVETRAATEFENRLGNEVLRDQFFSDLREGDLVELDVEQVGSDESTLVATEVEIIDTSNQSISTFELQGKITDVNDSSFKMAGQTIQITALTEFEDGAQINIKEGVFVEVDAIQSSNNRIEALEIEFKQQDSKSSLDLEGTISAFNSVTEFEVNKEWVTTNEDTAYFNGTSSDLELGAKVELELVISEDGQLLATEIEFDNDNEQTITGTVSHFISAKDFKVNDISITTTADTDYEQGNVSRLTNGERITVEGFINTSNVLVADEIEFEALSPFEAKGSITRYTSKTDFAVLGTPVITNAQTEFKESSESQLQLDTFVEVKGFIDSSGLITATYVEVKDDDISKLKGRVSQRLSETQFVINNVNIEISADTEFSNGTNTDLALNAYLEIEGIVRNGVLIADKVDFKDL